jgi:hypothetical protein
MKFRMLGSLCLSLLICISAQAAVVTLDFSATNFGTIGAVAPAPTTPVNGQFVWSAASEFSPIDQLLSATLTIDGHSYALGELGFQNGATLSIIGGLTSGINVVSATGSPDFFLSFDRTTETFSSFAYGVAGNTTTLWYSADGTISVRASEVPEPGSLALLGLGLAALADIRKRKKA